LHAEYYCCTNTLEYVDITSTAYIKLNIFQLYLGISGNQSSQQLSNFDNYNIHHINYFPIIKTSNTFSTYNVYAHASERSA